jgi:hypothetical protein
MLFAPALGIWQVARSCALSQSKLVIEGKAVVEIRFVPENIEFRSWEVIHPYMLTSKEVNNFIRILGDPPSRMPYAV